MQFIPGSRCSAVTTDQLKNNWHITKNMKDDKTGDDNLKCDPNIA